MMTVEEWRKRAHACTAASRRTSDREAQLQWESLSEAWLNLCEIWPGPAKQGEPGKSGNEAIPVAIAGGERLRERLALQAPIVNLEHRVQSGS